MVFRTVGRKEFFDNFDEFITLSLPVKIADFHQASKNELNLSKITDILKENVVSEKIHFSKLAPKFNGRYFYNDKVTGMNFEHSTCSIKEFFQLLDFAKTQKNYFSAQAIPVNVVFNEYMQSCFKCKELPSEADVRLWIGNQCNTAAHFDFSHNIAHVLKGKRSFKLFPTEQINNLYVGPISLTPGGTPVSMVDVSEPDFQKFPKFRDALDHAIDIELEPGEAIFIPNLWWHAVQSLENENILVNYWWRDVESNIGSLPFDSLVFLMSYMPYLPLEERKSWQAIFNYYVFQVDVDPTMHLPNDLHDILMNLSENDKQNIKSWFKGKL